MRRGLAKQTSHAANRTSDTGNGPPNQQPLSRSRPAQHRAPLSRHVAEDQDQARPRSARRHSYQPLTTPSSKQSQDVQSAPERKAPAYLQSKNPYGQVLDAVEHPYREPRAAHEALPAAQAGASPDSRPRTAGVFHFKTRLTPVEPERTVAASTSEPRRSPPRQPAKHISVQAAKNFFERKAFQAESASCIAPSAAVASAARTSLSRTQPSEETSAWSRTEPVHLPHTREPERLSEQTLVTAAPLREGDTQDRQSQRNKSSKHPTAKHSFTNIVLSKDVDLPDYAVADDVAVVPSSAAHNEDNSMKRRTFAQGSARQSRHR
jgi:hypothetical protein